MKNNNKQAGIGITFIIIIIIGLVVWFFIPKDYFKGGTKSGGSSFGQFNHQKNPNHTPQTLKWKKSFQYEKNKNGTKKQSYMEYMREKKSSK